MKKYEQLYVKMKDDISSGKILPGERLPSLHEQSLLSGVSKNTVLKAYELLVDAGFTKARERGGFYARRYGIDAGNEAFGEFRSPVESCISQSVETGERLDQLYESLLHYDRSFAIAAPGTDILPGKQLADIWRGLPQSWMSYGNAEGDLSLRRRIALAGQEANAGHGADDIVVTNGGTEALSIILETLLSPGDVVVIESPSYHNFFRQLAPLKVKLIEIPVTRDGIDLDLLEDTLKTHPVRLILVQPNVQNPTGISMSEQAKIRLIDLARRHESFLVQDDVYGDLYFSPVRPRNLSYYSDYSGIILCSSYSKSVSPGLRIGWIASPAYARSFAETKLRFSMESCRSSQQLLTNYVGTRAHQRQLQLMRKTLEQRVLAHIQFLRDILPAGSSLSMPSGGCLIWLALPEGIDAVEIFERCAGKGLIAAPGPMFSQNRYFQNFLRLNAGNALSDARRQALSLLSEALP